MGWRVILRMEKVAILAMVKRATPAMEMREIPRMGTGGMLWPEILAMASVLSR
jgi:hypothetical protein